jgi:Tol biopolymer transport system component
VGAKPVLLLSVAAVAVLLAGGARIATGAPGQGRIAFARDLGGLSGDLTSLYTIRPIGTGLRRVTAPPTLQALGGDSGPTWSPNGLRLVFERNLPYWGTDRIKLMMVSSHGGAARALTSGPFDAMPSWSPDGQRIAFTRIVPSLVAPSAPLFTVDRGGRHAARLVGGEVNLTAAWSPDGKTIAFSRVDAGADEPLEAATLYLANADGSNVRQLGDTPVHGVSPAWSPDGKRLAFVSFADDYAPPCPANSCPPSGELYVIGADGSGLRRLTRSRADDEHPTWSPTGARLAFASGFSLRTQGHAPWLMTMPARGGKTVRIGRFSGVVDPSWSPAGVR